MDIVNLLIGLGIIGVVAAFMYWRSQRRKTPPVTVGPIELPHQPSVQLYRPPELMRTHQPEPEPEAVDQVDEEAELRSRLQDADDASACWDIFNDAESGSAVETEALRKAVSVTRRELAEVTTIDEGWEVYNLLPHNVDDEDLDRLTDEICEKLLAFVSSTEEALALHDRYHDEVDAEDTEFLDRILVRALELATTPDEASDVYHETSEDSELERRSIARQLELIESVEECETMWDEHGIDTEFGRMAIVRAAKIIESTPPEEEPAEYEEA